MKSFKTVLLLPIVAIFLSACGGAVEGGGVTVDTSTDFKFIKGDPTTSVQKVCSITAEFDDPVDAASVTDQSFIIQATNSTNPLTSTSGSWGVSPSSSTIAIFTPSINLIGSFVVTLTTAITNTDGVKLSANESWQFTAQLPCTP